MRSPVPRSFALLVTLLVTCAALMPARVPRLGNLAGEGGYPCALHECGCTGAADCADGCCCFPLAPQPADTCCAGDAEEPDDAPREGLPAIDVFRCRGGLAPAVGTPQLFLTHAAPCAPPSAAPAGELDTVELAVRVGRRPAPESPPPRRSVVRATSRTTAAARVLPQLG